MPRTRTQRMNHVTRNMRLAQMSAVEVLVYAGHYMAYETYISIRRLALRHGMKHANWLTDFETVLEFRDQLKNL